MKNTLIFKNDNLTLSKGSDGFWLYDKSRGMNLAMKAATEQEAFVIALDYYKKRLAKIETELNLLENKVNNFLNSFSDGEE